MGEHRQGTRAPKRLRMERLEERRVLSLTHLYTFNDGAASDWIGGADGAVVGFAEITDGRLRLTNDALESGSALAGQAVLPAGLLPESGGFTIAAWFSADNAADWTRVFDIGGPSDASVESYAFYSPRGVGQARAGAQPLGGAAVLLGDAATDDATDHMVALVVDPDAGELRLYTDGVLSNASPIAGGAEGFDDTLFYLGRSVFSAVTAFTGEIDELRVYDEALDGQLIAEAAADGPHTETESPYEPSQVIAPRQLERLGRGLVALRSGVSNVYVGWRLLGNDPEDVAFNVYRSSDGGAPQLLNAEPLTQTTDYVDTGVGTGADLTYTVRPVVGGVEGPPGEPFTIASGAASSPYFSVPLDRPAGRNVVLPNGSTGDFYTYSANDASVGDLDGDGEYEILLKWEPSNARDNSQGGYTGNVLLEALEMDGTSLWRVDLGRNIRAGAHYTQFVVYDFDGDGRSEVILKTGDGTIDGVGTVIGNPAADHRNGSGYVLTGPEYLTVFDGLTGVALDTIDFPIERINVSQWGDNYGNRVDRFTATAAYLDGSRPSFVIGRGYYGPQSGLQSRNEVAAVDYRDGELQPRWLFRARTNRSNPEYIGQGAHSLTVGDVDGDGRDEIVYGASAIDDDGTGLYSTGLGHGDALHLSDMDPTRPGLEVFMVHESPSDYDGVGGEFRDAATGELLFGIDATNDVGRGMASDIDPNHLGYEVWGTVSGAGPRRVYNSQGEDLYSTNNISFNFAVWWDGDPLRELLDGTTISKWRYDLRTPAAQTVLSPSGVSSNNGTKATPALSADLFGDWREEVIWRSSSNDELRIYTTTTPAQSRIHTLMHDAQYRVAVSWQNGGYNQPPHPSFFIGAGMSDPPRPKLYFADELTGDFNRDGTVNAADYSVWRDTQGSTADLRADADHNGVVEAADYDLWKVNYGASSVAAASTGLAFGESSGLSDAALSSVASAPVALAALVTDGGLTTTASVDTELDAEHRDKALLLLYTEPGAQHGDPVHRESERPGRRARSGRPETRDAFTAFAADDDPFTTL